MVAAPWGKIVSAHWMMASSCWCFQCVTLLGSTACQATGMRCCLCIYVVLHSKGRCCKVYGVCLLHLLDPVMLIEVLTWMETLFFWKEYIIWLSWLYLVDAIAYYACDWSTSWNGENIRRVGSCKDLPRGGHPGCRLTWTVILGFWWQDSTGAPLMAL